MEPFIGQEVLDDVAMVFASGLIGSSTTEPEEFFRRYYTFGNSMAPSLGEILEETKTAVQEVRRLKGVSEIDEGPEDEK